MTVKQLQTHRTPAFTLESGEVIRDLEQGFSLEGEINEDGDNLVIIFHSLTGDPWVQDWWPGVVGPGAPVDPAQYAVLTPNLLGSCYGTSPSWSTGTAADGAPCESDGQGYQIRTVTPNDMVRLVHELVTSLGVKSVALAAGGSLGGMAALEWAAAYPDFTKSVIAFAAPAAHTAYAIGWNHVQRLALEQGGSKGLEIARMAAMMVYRTPEEFEARFGRERRDGQVFQMQSYLSYQGEKLLKRFDINSYLTLIGAMDAHDVGYNRGGIGAALGAFKGKLIGVGIPGDLLYTPGDVKHWVEQAQAHGANASYREIISGHGHDAFLLEPRQVQEIIRNALN